MRCGFYLLAASILLAAVLRAEEQPPVVLPTWEDEISKGFLPYHQLTLDDFAVKDRPRTDGGFYIKTFIHPRYEFFLKSYNGWIYAYPSRWIVFSGFDKNESWRNKKFKEMEVELPYAQAILDISETCGRELAALKEGELPQARGATEEAAQAELERKIKAFCQQRFDKAHQETEAFAKATKNGELKKKVRELAKDIRKKLEAAPVVDAPAQPPSSASATPSPAGSVTPLATSPVGR